MIQIIKYPVSPGTEITSCIKDAIDLSQRLTWQDQVVIIQFSFNQVRVFVMPDSNPELIYRDWKRALNGYIGYVNPYPLRILPQETIEREEALETAAEQRRQEERSKREAETTRAKQALEEKLSQAPKFDVLKKFQWWKYQRRNKDPYGKGINEFAKDWARLMQLEMQSGKELEDIALSTSVEADAAYGMSGFSYGCAVYLLTKVWRHGERLRRWHNLQTQAKDEGIRANEEGGVLNPAVLRVSS